ncbi:sirohydrochlorin chelatase [Mycobacterium riyadhense]|uniref:Sirohydrochlorin ferrochelatase n=1 Tax=Mycobacterium riyadhense TaxID=486698 RepID=A0A1X2BQK5_9MYCO|nr:sirohydrochlorin chelatase [Mycobacterium riyadhense]MCV7147086.1 sirohydrochlorin chelatase [Mycobacterium riyadhense]ORW65864.1 sirohydrochlorin ferrochelatase [Mycobacterium riyadhense]
MRVARLVTLVLTAHGSADPRSAANARAVARQIVHLRPDLDVRVAFCEHNSPALVDVLNRCRGAAVVTPLLLADAYHARVDIPDQIASCAASHRVWQANVLGEDDRLVSVLRQRVTELGVSPLDGTLGLLVVAIGSSNAAANARTAEVAPKLLAGTHWAAATTAFASRPEPSLAEAANELRRRGARRVIIAPWFLAPGRLPDRVQRFALGLGIPMAAPLGAHRLVAETVLDRFDRVAAERADRTAA